MANNEATARIKINKMLEAAGWRFFDCDAGAANICLESEVKITRRKLTDFGDNFEKTSRGVIDFLLLDANGFPFIVLEAKSENKNPLIGKEQARKYARGQNCRFVILSNGNLHYFWDLKRGNPHVIRNFPALDSVDNYSKTKPNPDSLVNETVGDDYIVLTQRPNYHAVAAWKNENEREKFITENKLSFLRDYQTKAIHALQAAVKQRGDRFLFEMATGTGKTLTSAAVIKLFLRTGNAKRALFLVDRLELESQAQKVFAALLANDYKSVIYKENRNDWRHAEIVVTTVQSLLFDNKFERLFSPTDFDLIISDEAHRSIAGNARAVFEYFVGYKLGLTATPRDYLKNIGKHDNDPRDRERRIMLDTYRTFGCADSSPTFRYSLVDGVEDGYLINPTVVDARSEVTAQLISERGFIVETKAADGEDVKEVYDHTDFEKKFFSKATNQLFCKVFLANALRDPVSNEIGKSIVFAVSQKHATKLTQIFNQLADAMFPGKYQSDFAVQVTSAVDNAQQFTIQFANNNLLGNANFIDAYRTSKARICVTVGMMTTGYDCPDILNLGLFRPIFSPTDFIQIKGRGTRKHNFLAQLHDSAIADGVREPDKTSFKLFDFFANCDYFENEFNYDEVIELPLPGGASKGNGDTVYSEHEYTGSDEITDYEVTSIGPQGMRIDRAFFKKFEDTVKEDAQIAALVESGKWDQVIDYVNKKVFDKPEEFYNLQKLRKAAEVDRRLTLREILEKVFGLIPRFKSKDELLEEEFNKFVMDRKPEKPKTISALKHYFKAYIEDRNIRNIIESGELTGLATNTAFSTSDYRAVPKEYRHLIPEYIKDYVSLNQFMP